MSYKNNPFAKVWAMPALLLLLTIVGLVSAIIGLGLWHFLSWISLAVPLIVMTKFGWKFFK